MTATTSGKECGFTLPEKRKTGWKVSASRYSSLQYFLTSDYTSCPRATPPPFITIRVGGLLIFFFSNLLSHILRWTIWELRRDLAFLWKRTSWAVNDAAFLHLMLTQIGILYVTLTNILLISFLLGLFCPGGSKGIECPLRRMASGIRTSTRLFRPGAPRLLRPGNINRAATIG